MEKGKSHAPKWEFSPVIVAVGLRQYHGFKKFSQLETDQLLPNYPGVRGKARRKTDIYEEGELLGLVVSDDLERGSDGVASQAYR